MKPLSPKIERAIILHLLNHNEASRSKLSDALGDDAVAIDSALERLRAIGLVTIDGDNIWPSRVCLYSNDLGLCDI
jgi:predicted transcriptional regulator